MGSRQTQNQLRNRSQAVKCSWESVSCVKINTLTDVPSGQNKENVNLTLDGCTAIVYSPVRMRTVIRNHRNLMTHVLIRLALDMMVLYLSNSLILRFLHLTT